MKILFIKPSNSSFILQDEKILKKNFKNISSFLYLEGNAFMHVISQIRLIFFLVSNIETSDFIYIWFASYHSLLPTLVCKFFQKKSIIVIGGHDAASVPELNYGAHRNKFRSWCVRKSADYASILLTVSKFTHENLFEFISKKNRKKTKLIYNGVDVKFFQRRSLYKKQSEAITVCGTSKVNILKLKGIDFFIKLSKSIPQYNFKIIGVSGKAREYIGNDLPDNLKIYPKIKLPELINVYSRATIICQFSRHEAFGMAVAEAMACECVPIAYNYGGLTELINGAGFLLSNLDINLAKQSIEDAFKNYSQMSLLARKRIVENFSKDEREKKLAKIFKELIGDNR